MNDYVRLAFTLASSIFWTAVMIVWMGIQVFKHKMDFFTQKKRERPPKVLDGWNHDSVKLSDVTLHYVHAGSTDKPLMLMVHGFPEFWYSWRYQIRHFQSKYRVVAVDLRGYNESDKPSGIANYSAARIGQDLQELVIALGYKSCVLLAHDWGGAIAWGVAARYPEIVDRLVICNCPHPKGMQKAIQSDRGQLLKSWYMFFFQCPILPELMFKARDFKFLDQALRGRAAGIKNRENFTDDDMEAWKYTFSRPGSITPPINYYRAAFQTLRAATLPKAPIQAKTLIIWGTGDNFLQKAGATYSVDYCRDAKVQFIEGASHWVQQDEPQLVNRYIEEFLAE